MPNRTMQEQYEYERNERNLSHEDAINQMRFMFPFKDLLTIHDPDDTDVFALHSTLYDARVHYPNESPIWVTIGTHNPIPDKFEQVFEQSSTDSCVYYWYDSEAELLQLKAGDMIADAILDRVNFNSVRVCLETLRLTGQTNGGDNMRP